MAFDKKPQREYRNPHVEREESRECEDQLRGRLVTGQKGWGAGLRYSGCRFESLNLHPCFQPPPGSSERQVKSFIG